ncbi:hypothetical protein MF672_017895 [Actinomadura sp. ATCC 31491]|uniref:DUF1648 domain-containing protein n=1 Tax=Actinomadura luzonensis TaxID=2805427 RepID=A0ABT0FTK7_9ACTN|nr:hypothetical protein [Actinomadura luzonensis]MCK2215647.1 hypothetical protein [Actinomadura luzonensis]
MPRDRIPLALMYAGAGLTAFAAIFPFVDRATTTVLADHVRAGYPAYDGAAIDAAVGAYLAILAVVGALGLLGWLGAILAVRAGKRWATWAAGALLVIAIGVAVAALTVRDTSGDVGLAPLLGWLLVLPCVPGLAAVVLRARTA